MPPKNKILLPVLVLALAAAVAMLFFQQQKITRIEAKLPAPRTAAAKVTLSIKGDASPADNLARLKSILALRDPFQMMRELMDFAGGLNAAAIPPLLDYLVKLPGTTHNTGQGMYAFMFMQMNMGGQSTSNNQTALSLLIDRLVHLDPNNALTWAAAVANLHGREEVIGMVFASWANINPAQALAAAGQIDDKVLRETVIGQIAQDMISTNPAAALAALQALPQNRTYMTIISQVFSSWAGTDPQARARGGYGPDQPTATPPFKASSKAGRRRTRRRRWPMPPRCPISPSAIRR